MLALYFKNEDIFTKKEKKRESYLATNGPGNVYLTRANRSLYEMQCMMDQNGATDLVIDLVMEDPSPSVFHESIQLAIALLEGGNGSVQVSSNICLVVMHIPNIALPL